jgi:hypothetical protein
MFGIIWVFIAQSWLFLNTFPGLLEGPGLDLENYCTAPKDQIFAGYNSNTDDIYCVMDFKANAATPVARFDAFALFDEVIIFENNTAFVRY